ncbi:MAG: hypothetical protein H6841_10040 [Planctomycetes bacterium]|nr:hypothetical protein [Planctomycetota bacterium]MCB9936012.1 hypothetical protein [Planctomycetota bacterium]
MTVYSTIIKGGVFRDTRRSRQDTRLPEDSGEWRAVPLKFQHLPGDPFDWDRRGERAEHGRLLVAATLLPVVQLVVGLGILYASCGSNCATVWWFLTPLVIGFFTSLAATCIAVSGTVFRVGQALEEVLRGQLWWFLLLLIPCYGWGLLVVCVPMCVLGTFAGTLLGAGMQNMEAPTPRSRHGNA